MKQTLFSLLPVLAGTLLVVAPAAHADIAWQHLGSVTLGGKPVVNFDLRNYWSGDNHRAQLTVDATAATRAFSSDATSMVPSKGTAVLVERLSDDHLILALPDFKMHIDEPYTTFKSRLRLNLWDALDPQLAKDPVPPELTPEQRQRLGHELRAVISPATSQVSKVYFAALPATRVINGMTCHGYRYTSLTNVEPQGKGQQWMKSTAEWWLAERAPEDQQIIDFTTKANQIHKDAGPPTVSMWLNEIAPIMWEAAPEQSHAALASMIGKLGDPDYGFRGTPMLFTITATPPPAAHMPGGAFKVAIHLNTRSLVAITPDKFQAPAGSTRQPIEPFLQMASNALKQAQGKIGDLVKQGMDGKMKMPTLWNFLGL